MRDGAAQGGSQRGGGQNGTAAQGSFHACLLLGVVEMKVLKFMPLITALLLSFLRKIGLQPFSDGRKQLCF
ncbi:hypothetical protein LP416_03180 [Polaromonas sp. P2-4]|nr:hypothetical protein LP416_03180 [Polaromonas sp. P2-4]